MQKSLFPALALILGFYALMAQDKRPMPAQAQRGHDLFVKYDKGMACGTCHELAGTGTAVGPDLKTLGSAVGPHGLVMAMVAGSYPSRSLPPIAHPGMRGS